MTKLHIAADLDLALEVATETPGVTPAIDTLHAGLPDTRRGPGGFGRCGLR